MNDAAWFGLMLRVVGVLLAGLGLPDLLAQFVRTAEWLHRISETGWTAFDALSMVGYLVAASSQVVLGCYFVLDGRHVVAWCVRERA